MANDPDVLERLKKAFNKDGVNDQSLRECAEHGSAGGSGLVYYSETCEFYDKNEEDLWELLEQEAEEMGSKNIMEFIGNFASADSVTDLDTFKNLIVWYAQEEVGHSIMREEDEG